MQIVIDIPEETYKATCNGCMLPPDVDNVVRGIKNGTPLPDGAEILTKEAYSDLCTRAADVPGTNVGELISRKAAIDAIQRLNIPEDMCVFEIKSHILVAIATLPPVEPERKPGKWLLKIEDWNRWTCSECGFSTRTDIHVTLGYDYCPKCGAKMEVES